jgi:PAS domain S-box-containing protein
MFGYSRDELIGRSPQFLAHDEETAKGYVARGRENYARTGFYQEKMLCRKKDGSAFMTAATNIVLFDGNGEQKYVLAINRDLSQEEKMLDNIVRLSEQSSRLLQTLNESIRPLKSALPIISLGSLGFSRRQIDIAAILVTGETTKAIAAKLKVSESAIKNHLSIMYRRLGVSSRMELMTYLHERKIRIE